MPQDLTQSTPKVTPKATPNIGGISGFGGGGGGGKGGGGGGVTSGAGATEAPNTLRSTQYATVLDALSEGPIYGLVNGAQSIYFDKVPLQNLDGTYNFNNATFGYTTGDLASNQHASSAISGDAGNIEATTSVGVQVWQATPIVRTVTQANVDHIRITISTPALTSTNTSNGNVNGNSVSFAIDIQTNGGGFVRAISDSFNGKTTSKYTRDYLIAVSGSGPWDIRATRLSGDDPNTYSQSQIWFDEYTSIISTKLEYRHTAIAGISIDARQFSAIPTRAYDLKGMIINIPSNYDPIARMYAGVWDGTFKLAWSDNPAWCFYDLLTNGRYGLGNYLPANLVDKWQLYTIAQYCDELVPDGYGGQEPRFSCNLYITSEKEAYKAIQDLASIFRSITYWASGAVSIVQDAPSDPIQLFTTANVIDGAFNYQGASSKAMHTVCLVSYKDPNNWYQDNVEYVQNDLDVAQYGVIPTSITAIGCTSRGQAHRLGKWLLYSEKLESETISFRAGMDAVYCYPGAIIQTSDPVRSGARMGGRVLGISADFKTITVDSSYVIEAGSSPNIQIMMPDGTIFSDAIVSSSSSAQGNFITLANTVAAVPTDNALYLISQTDIEPELWRVISVAEVSDGNVLEISAVAHNPSKYGYVEDGYNLTIPSVSSIHTIPAAPSGLSAISSWYVISVGVAGLTLTLSWSGSANYYNITYSINCGQTIQLTQSQQSLDIANVKVGDVYAFSICAVSSLGISSGAASLSYTVTQPAPIYPADVTGLSATVTGNGVLLSWNDIADPMLYDYEIREGVSWDSAVSLGFFNGTSTTVPALLAANYSWMIKARNSFLNESIDVEIATFGAVAPSAVVLSANLSGQNYVLSWGVPASMFPIDHYIIATGPNALNLTSLSLAYTTQYQSQAQFSGSRTFWVAGVDSAGNTGPYTNTQIVVSAPSKPIVTNQVIDNNVLLYWTDATQSLPITTYQIYKGSTFAGAELIGNKSGLFTAIFETAAGAYTYWIAGVDSAGNVGQPGQITAVVSAPPNYVLHSDIFSTFGGALVNATSEDGLGITMPVNTSQTWAQHFSGNAWNTPNDQVNAGYPIYAQPALISGYYEEVIDYGSTLPAVNVIVTPTITAIAGNPTTSVMISCSNASAAGPWIDYPNTSQIYLTNFRWVKARITAVSPDDKSLVEMTALEIKLSVQLKDDAGSVIANALDVNGTNVNFNVPFIDVTSISVTPQGSTPLNAVYAFSGVADPTNFQVFLFNASGVRVSGPVSWSAKGF